MFNRLVIGVGERPLLESLSNTELQIEKEHFSQICTEIKSKWLV